MYDTPKKGWVADDIHSESASRTLDYACQPIFVYLLRCTPKLITRLCQMTTTPRPCWRGRWENRKRPLISFWGGPWWLHSVFGIRKPSSWKRETPMAPSRVRLPGGLKVRPFPLCFLFGLEIFLEQAICGLIRSTLYTTSLG